MMNSSSLSKAGLLGGAAGVAIVADLLLVLLGGAPGPVTALAMHGLAFGALAGAALQLRRCAAAMARAAEVCRAAVAGDLEARILEVPEPGALGVLQRSVNAMLDITDAFVREASGSMAHVSRGKYFRKVLLRGLPGTFQNAARTINEATDVMAAKVRAFDGLADTFERSVGSVVETVASAATQMHASATALSQTASDTSAEATSAAASTEQASVNVQTVATAAEELAASVAEVGRQVTHSSQIARKAVAEAERTNTTVTSLSDITRKVGDVVQLISDIASQTNLLALNATIEAARAGEAGKGFAVVASEVKALANQTAKATEEIGAQITAMLGATEQAVGAIQGIGGTIGEMNEIAATIAAAVEEQGAATREIARNIQEAATGTQSVAANIVGVTDAAGMTGSAAGEVLSAATDLSEQSKRLSAEVAAFLKQARAA